jgi:hypothetical protein
MKLRLWLPVVALLGCAGMLAAWFSSDATPEDRDVWVYYTSLCAAPGDDSNCRPVERHARPGFPTLESCAAFRAADLDRSANPRLMGTCERLREA